ncbi:hypothetical protein ACFL6I_16260 [candidate division KSB1 bacterium]
MILIMPSKITPINKSQKVTPNFTCKYCGSHKCESLPGQGRVAGRFEKKIVCMKCKRVVSEA